MNAIDNNNYEIANLLLDQGANPHISDWWGRTALYLAVDMRTRGVMTSFAACSENSSERRKSTA